MEGWQPRTASTSSPSASKAEVDPSTADGACEVWETSDDSGSNARPARKRPRPEGAGAFPPHSQPPGPPRTPTVSRPAPVAAGPQRHSPRFKPDDPSSPMAAAAHLTRRSVLSQPPSALPIVSTRSSSARPSFAPPPAPTLRRPSAASGQGAAQGAAAASAPALHPSPLSARALVRAASPSSQPQSALSSGAASAAAAGSAAKSALASGPSSGDAQPSPRAGSCSERDLRVMLRAEAQRLRAVAPTAGEKPFSTLEEWLARYLDGAVVEPKAEDSNVEMGGGSYVVGRSVSMFLLCSHLATIGQAPVGTAWGPEERRRLRLLAEDCNLPDVRLPAANPSRRSTTQRPLSFEPAVEADAAPVGLTPAPAPVAAGAGHGDASGRLGVSTTSTVRMLTSSGISVSRRVAVRSTADAAAGGDAAPRGVARSAKVPASSVVHVPLAPSREVDVVGDVPGEGVRSSSRFLISSDARPPRYPAVASRDLWQPLWFAHRLGLHTHVRSPRGVVCTERLQDEVRESPFTGSLLPSRILIDDVVAAGGDAVPPRLRLLLEVRRRVPKVRAVCATERDSRCREVRDRAEMDSIHYCHLQQRYVRRVNELLTDLFWPGVDVADHLAYPDYSVVVLYRQLVVGAACMTPEGYVTYIGVRPGWDGAGIGSFMLYFLVAALPQRDLTLHVALTNPALILYQRFGFKPERLIAGFYEGYLRGTGCMDALFCRLRVLA